jgi:hypothetical protein
MIETLFLAVHVLGRLGVAGLMTFKVMYFRDALNPGERFGMGLMGGCSLMTIPVILDTAGTHHGTPFDVWSPTGVTWGIVIFFISRLRRIMRHAKANDLARTEAAAWLANRRQE